LVQERARPLTRLQNVLEDANIKLASVVSDIGGVSARSMLEALTAGARDVTVLSALARGRMRSKQSALEDALRGHFMPHQSFLLTAHLSHLDY
jgi:transposase